MWENGSATISLAALTSAVESIGQLGTSGHRSSPFSATFTEAHILAITQAICDYRRSQAIDGLLWGKTRMAKQAGRA
jgi:phosphoglucomutase